MLVSVLQIPWASSVDREILDQLGIENEVVPRRGSGRIDFVQLLDESAYLEPDKNCLVEIVELFGMDMDPPPPAIMKALGNPDILPIGERLVELDEYLRKNLSNLDSEELDSFYEIYQKTWNAELLPEGKQWIEENNQLIDRLVTASQKMGYYHPYRDDGEGLVFAVLLPGAHRVRSAARVLHARAMYRLGNNEIDEAISDLVAIKRIGSKLNAAPFLVEKFVGVAVNGIAHDGICELLGSDLNKQQLESLRAELSSVVLSQSKENHFFAERLAALDFIEWASRGNFSTNYIGIHDDVRLNFLFSARTIVDWEVAANSCGSIYDKLETIQSSGQDAQKLSKMKQFFSEFEQRSDQIRGTSVLGPMLAGSRSRGFIAGQLVCEHVLPAINSLEETNVRQLTRRDLANVAIGVELFRLANNRYPTKLAELVPEYLDSVPLDRHSGQGIHFATSNTHYYISSVGPDGNDDLQTLLQCDEDQHHQYDDAHSWVMVRIKQNGHGNAK